MRACDASTRLLVLALCLCLAGATARADPLDDAGVRERVQASAPSAHEDAEILFEGHYFRLDDQGRVEERHQRLLRIHSEHALERVADPRIAHDAARQELIVSAVRSYLPGGRIVDSPVNAINELTPAALALSVDHLHLRETVVSHVGLVPGVSVWLDYTLRDKTPAVLAFNRLLFPQGDWPVVEMEVLAAGGLRGATINPEGGLASLPEPTREGDALRWQLRALPARPGEASRRLGDQIPYLVLSAAGGWETLLGDLALRLEAAAQTDSLLEAWIEKLQEPSPFLTERDALSACLAALSERCTPLNYRSWEAMAVPRPVSRVLERSEAAPMERCAVILACCRERGLDAGLLLPARWLAMSRELPALELMASPGLWIEDPRDPEALWWADPASGELRPSLAKAEGLPVLLVHEGGVEWRWEPVRAPLLLDLSLHWDLASGALEAEGRLEGFAFLEQDLERPEEFLRNWIEGWQDSTRLSGLSILSQASGRLAFTLTATAPVPAADERGRLLLDFPLPFPLTQLKPEGLNLAQSRCRARLFPAGPLDARLLWRLRLPKDGRIVAQEGASADFRAARLSVQRGGEGERAELDYRLSWEGSPIEPAEYSGYRSFLLAALDPSMTRFVVALE